MASEPPGVRGILDPVKRTIVRFMFKVTLLDNGCWQWLAATDKDGYGTFQYEGSKKRAHAFSYELFNGPIPKGKIVCHKCDYPSCVNPSHLYAGTTQENVSDRVARIKLDSHWSRKYPELKAKVAMKRRKKHEFRGSRKTLNEISQETGVPLRILKFRSATGWDIEKAVSTPYPKSR